MKEYIPEMVLLLLVGCAGAPLTEDERIERDYKENERVVMWNWYEQWCQRQVGATMYARNPDRPCRTTNCIPDSRDWKWDYEKNRPHIGNRYQCVRF